MGALSDIFIGFGVNTYSNPICHMDYGHRRIIQISLSICKIDRQDASA